MARDVPRDWMWSEACEMLARAERMHRELFRPADKRNYRRGSRRSIFWKPSSKSWC
jgi:HSP20 family protein